MVRYAVLLNFTEKGLMAVRETTRRAAAFRQRVEAVGGKLDLQIWTIGPYDGLLLMSVADETTAAGLVLGLVRDGYVRTTMMRALDETEIGQVVEKMT